jgi:hypothetical protein
MEGSYEYIEKKQSRTAEQWWLCSFWVGRGANKSSPKKNKLVTKMFKKPWTWTVSLEERPTRKKMDMRFGTWNARSMYRAGSLRAVAAFTANYRDSFTFFTFYLIYIYILWFIL